MFSIGLRCGFTHAEMPGLLNVRAAAATSGDFQSQPNLGLFWIIFSECNSVRNNFSRAADSPVADIVRPGAGFPNGFQDLASHHFIRRTSGTALLSRTLCSPVELEQDADNVIDGGVAVFEELYKLLNLAACQYHGECPL